MKVASIEELRRHALANGAEVVMNGRTFNAARERVVSMPKPPVEMAPKPVEAPPEPVLAAPIGVTREEMDAALAGRDAHWAQQLNAITEAFKMALVGMANRQPTETTVLHWKFDVTYDKDGAIQSVAADAG